MKNFEIVAKQSGLSLSDAKSLILVYKNPYIRYNIGFDNLINLGYLMTSTDSVVSTSEGDDIIEKSSAYKVATVSEFNDYLLSKLIKSGFVLKDSTENNTSIMTKSLGTKLFAVDVNKKGTFRLFVTDGPELTELKQLSYTYKLSKDQLRCYLTYSCDFDKIDKAVDLLKEIV